MSANTSTRRDTAHALAVADNQARKAKPFLFCLVLAVVTLALYWPALHFGFISLDDPAYVSENPMVQQGLSGSSAIWAFTTSYFNYWQPMTWLSHMLDYTIFGRNPGAFHAVSLVLHLANSVLVFFLLKKMTHAFWRSAFVAAVFAVHPIHIESVVWLAERKDVLSTFFWLWTIWFYVSYVQKRAGVHERKGTATSGKVSAYVSFSVSVLFFALALMSKPMVVTLPCVLLLLDYWPLGRFAAFKSEDPNSDDSASKPHFARFVPLLIEKVPFFILSVASSIITIIGQHRVGALASVANLPVLYRLGSAAFCYVRYIRKTIWPNDLALLYPYAPWPIWQMMGAAVILVLISLLVWRSVGRAQYLPVGWFVFLGVLFPVSGIMQAGPQVMADRFAYVAVIGLFIALSWGVYDMMQRWKLPRSLVAVAAVCVLGAGAVTTNHYLRFWRSSAALFEHTLKVTEDNPMACVGLGTALLFDEKKPDEAITQFERALQLNPLEAKAHCNLAAALQVKKEFTQAKEHYLQALKTDPNLTIAWLNSGVLFSLEGKLEEAMARLKKALELEPQNVAAHKELAVVLLKLNQLPDAAKHLEQVIALQPDHAYANRKLGEIYTDQGQIDRAERYLQISLRSEPESGPTHFDLGLIYLLKGQEKEAAGRLVEAARLMPAEARPFNEVAWIFATAADPQLRNGAEAVRYAERACELTAYQQPEYLGTLDAAYAEAGRFQQAIETAERARGMFLKNGQTNLAELADKRIALYRDGKPFHSEGSKP